MNEMSHDNRKKAVFLDLDGTLWDHSHTPESALKAIDLARKNGHLVLVNTGRTVNGIPEDLWDMNLDAYCLCAGMSLYRSKYEPVVNRYLDRDRINALIDIFHKHGTGFSMETPTMSFYDPIYYEISPFFTRFPAGGDLYQRKPISEMSDEDWTHVQKFHFEAPNPFDLQTEAGKLDFIAHFFASKYSEGGQNTAGFRGELNDIHHDKARVMRESLKALDLNPDDYVTVAIGDSNNDIPMIRAADIGISMGNGSDEVKAAASLVTDELFHDGLYKAFEKIGLFQTENEKKSEEA